MKSHGTWILAAGLALLGCNRAEPLKEPPQRNAPSTMRGTVRTPDTTASVGNDPTVEKIQIRATVEDGEAAEVASADVALNVSRAGIVSGTFSLGDIPLAVRGTKNDGELRLWVNGTTDAPDKIRRGLMIGTVQDGKAEGTFVISGNGGTPVLKGSWQSVN